MRTNLDLNAVLDVVYQQVTRLLQTPNFSVALVDTGRNQLYFPLNIEQHHQASLPPRELKDGLIEYVIQQKVPLLIADHVAQHTQALGLTPPPMPVYSWMAVPLVAPERVLGCLVVYSSNPAQLYTKNDLRLLATLAGQVGIAIDNAQLYGQAKDRSMQLSTLNNVANILSGTLDIQQTLDLTGSSAIAVANCDAMALYMWGDGIQRPLTLARQNGLSEAFTANPMQPLMLTLDDLHRRRQPMIVTDVLIDHRAADLRPVMDREQNRSWIEFLLRKGEDLIGVLIFFYEKPRAFNAEEIELLRNFSNQAALAISNARLYTQTDAALNRRVEQLSALADISRELVSTLNLQGLFELVLSRALEATQSRTGLLLIRQETTDAAPSLVAHRGFEPGLFDKINPLSNYVAQTYQTGLPTLIPDFAQERDFTPNDPKTHSQLNVPIVQGEDVLGVISLGNDRANEYSQDDMSFVTQLAVQARIAIDNARLFRNIEIARDRLQVILDSMKEAVILINPEGLITLANPRVDRLLGLAPERILHIPIASLLGDPDLQMAARLGFGGDDALLNSLRNLGTGHWDESSRDSGRVTFEIATPKRRFIDRTDAPVRDETGHAIGLLMVFADVTEERELAQAREDLSSMIVHDLRGPLTALTTSLTLLDEIASEDDPFGKVVIHTTDLASRAVRKMLNLVNSLLDVSKMESGTIALEQEPTQFTQLCINVVDELSPLAQEMAVSLMADLPENLPLLYVDADKTERVLLNLVDNAIKFAPQDGSIVIRAHQPGSIPVPDGFMRLEVQDTGPGIPDEYKERLFDRYAQVDGVRGRRRGTGLGLTFCRMAIEAHGGKIWVEDNPAGGTVFVFTLPLVDIKKLELSNTD
jgi:signal transduction histidine kinase